LTLDAALLLNYFQRWQDDGGTSQVSDAPSERLEIKTVLTILLASLGGLAVVWGIFIQMGPAMAALYQGRKGKLTPQQLAIEMAAQSDQQLLDLFPKVFDLSDEQQRELFPSALAMFPDGFRRSLEALDAARVELQKRNIPVPQPDFQPLRFLQLKESRVLMHVLSWCIFIALFSVPMSLGVMRDFDNSVARGENHARANFAAIFIQIATPILAVISTLGLVVIPCVFLVQYAVFRNRRRKVAALSEAIAGARVQPENALGIIHR
jgi:hypothetical protein